MQDLWQAIDFGHSKPQARVEVISRRPNAASGSCLGKVVGLNSVHF